MAPTPQESCVGREQQPPPLDGERVVISGMAGLYPNSPHVKELERILYNKVRNDSSRGNPHSMAPAPQEPCVGREQQPPLDGERVVISGMAGLYSNSPHVKELERILYTKENPVTDEHCRWSFSHPEVNDHIGNVPGLDRFDGQFFKVHYRLGNAMDAMGRKILEQAYQAIYDAGVSPEHLNGKKVGVYTGSCFSEAEKAGFYVATSRTGFGIAGCSKTMFANRISYWLNAKGPSMSIDAACCSSIAALEQGYLAITRGECEAALVGGCHLCLHPQSSVHYGRIMTLCSDGKTKSFDEKADGVAKSEAVNVLFLQKAKDAKRIYAEVLYVKTEFRSILRNENGDPKFGFYRDPGDVADFLKQFYEEARVPPQAVEYVEAFGSAVPEADKAELEAIDKVFCENRQDPLLVGSVMSNIGYGEAASGISAITKVLLGYQKGSLAGNLHCESPRRDVAALRDGRMQIVTEQRAFGRSYTAVNGISVTGVNAHVLLHGHYKPKDLNRYKSAIPRLLTISGRQDTAVRKIVDDLKTRPIDPEEHALFHNIHQHRISGHMGRGYVILDTDEAGKTVALAETVSYFDDSKRPLWFVYSGMGSQWAGMGAQLMRVPVFAAAIDRCRKALESKGIDIVHIITSPDKAMFDNILHSFVGIAAIQIGLTDVLTSLGIVPDKIIGHSVGELGCAYADGCFTAEEMILSAYSRGLVSVQTPFIRGSMAAVGIGYQQIRELIPPEIEVACHNGPESSTISGPADKMKEFVAELTAKGIFAKEVPCSNIAYHSRYIAEAGPGLLKYLSEVIKEPKLRSERWVSSSVPQEQWDKEEAKYSSAYYHTNNLLNPVLFEETSRLIPANAVTLEIAPHGLLQAILKRSLPESCKHIALTRRGHHDNAFMVLDAVGKLYMEGYLPKVQALYPPVQFPVSTGTPMLSHLVEWAHTERWTLPVYLSASRKQAASCKWIVTTHDKEYNFLKGNFIRGKTLYPFAAGLVAVWDTLAMSLNKKRKQLSAEFRDVHLYAQPPLLQHTPLRLNVALHRVNGRFEILSEDRKIADGFIHKTFQDVFVRTFNLPFEPCEKLDLTSDDVYRMLFERDYFYRGDFRSIHRMNKSLTEAQIIWNDNWVTFLDGILQLNALRTKHDTVAQPSYIRKICIDLKKHKKNLSEMDGKIVASAQVFDFTKAVRCGGVVIEDIQFRKLPVLEETAVTLKTLRYQGEEYIASSRVQVSAPRGVTLRSSQLGDLDALHWVEADEISSTNGIPVTVHYAGINEVDVKKATGVIPVNDDESSYAMDFSGVTDLGLRVMGVVEGGAASGRVAARAEMLWPVPAHWSLEDAATVPLAYAHAFYILDSKVQFLRRDSCLVHGAAGALGQALVSILLAHDCEVFATVSDPRKKRFLLKLFPQLREDHVGNSRDASFSNMVLSVTQGKGCKLVFSCLKSDLKSATFNCVSEFGVMIDTAQVPNQEPYSFGMANLSKERNYYQTDFSSIFTSNNVTEMKRLQALISEGIARGYVRPLSRVTYSPEEVSRAFRLLASSRHRGRVLIRLQDKVTVVEPRLNCSPHRCHVVIYDEQTFGLQFVQRLVSRGAKYLRLHCSSQSHNLQIKMQSWEEQNVKIQVSSEDLTDSKNVIRFLSESNSWAPIEGIYIIAADPKIETVDKVTSMIANLDLVSRKLCPSLRYFGVMNSNLSIGQQTCMSRENNRLPVTVLNIPALRRLGDTDPTLATISWRSAVNAAEKAIRSPHGFFVARSTNVVKPTLLQEISVVADLKNPENVEETVTLMDLGIDMTKVPAIFAFLRDTHNIVVSVEDIPNLTIQRIRELHDVIHDEEVKDVSGLSSFFSYVDPDELLATTEFVTLPTLINNSTMRDDEFNVNQTHLCIIPGLEGHHNRFQTLCERLKLPALVLQPGLDFPEQTFTETANRYAKILLEKMCLRNNFYLLGFESGVSVALEVASILESNGMTGTVFCLGGTTEEFQNLLEEHLGDIHDDEALQDAVVSHMFTLMTGQTEDINKALRDVSDWKQKVEVCVRMLLGRVPHSAQYAKNLIDAAYNRIRTARSHKMQPKKLNSKLVLLHASSLHSELPPAASLQSYSQHPIAVHQLQEPLTRATQDLRCSAIINNYLDPEILKAYEEKNLCDTYLLNSDTFMVNATDLEENGK